MSDLRDQLERERRKFALGDEAMERLERLRDRRRRNRTIGTIALAFVLAAGGTGGALLAFHTTHRSVQPVITPSPSTVPVAPSHVLPQPTGPIQFVDTLHGWMVWNGRIFATSDGGRSWQQQVCCSAAGIQFIDRLHGWGRTTNQSIEYFQTTDGGARWIYHGVEGTDLGPLTSIEFVSPNVGWALHLGVGDKSGLGRLLKFDGTGEWRIVDTPGLVQSFCFSDALHGIATDGDRGNPTTDGGRYWETLPTSDLMFPRRQTPAVRCGPGSEGWLFVYQGMVAGSEPYVLLYAPDGYSWQPVLHEGALLPEPTGPSAQDPYPGPFAVTGAGSLAFVGWCPTCGEPPAIYLTRDRGANWQRFVISAATPGWVPLGLSFSDHDLGWLLFESPSGAQVLATKDGGRTWSDPCGHPRSSCFGTVETP